MASLLPSSWALYAAVLLATILVNAALFRRGFQSAVDPLLVVFLQTTFAISTVLLSRLILELPDDRSIALVLVEHVAFVIGLLAGTRSSREEAARLAEEPSLAAMSPVAVRQLLWVLRISTALLVLVTLIRLRTGFFIFDADPELARTEARFSGLGYLYRLTHALSIVNVAALVGLALERAEVSRALRVAGWLLPVMLTLTTGYKADLVLLYTAAYFAVLCLRGAEVKRIFKLRTMAILLAVIVVVSLIGLARRFDALVLGSTYASAGDFAVSALLDRFALNGGGLNFFLIARPEQVASYGPLTFVWNYAIAPFLAPFGLTAYPPTLGSILAMEMTGDDTFGPNPTMYMEGIVYWSAWGAPVYCFLLGRLLAWLRGLFPWLCRRTALSRGTIFVVACYWAAISLSTTVDLVLVVSGLFNFVGLVVPILALSAFLARASGAAEDEAGATAEGRTA